MSEVLVEQTVGQGSPSSDLTERELTAILQEALEPIRPHQRVLAVVPDKTRDDNTDILFPLASQMLEDRSVDRFDVLVAQGTHPPMSMDQKLSKLGLTTTTSPFAGNLFDHRWS